MKLIQRLEKGKFYIGYIPDNPTIYENYGITKAMCLFKCEEDVGYNTYYKCTIYKESVTNIPEGGRMISINSADIFNGRNFTYELTDEEVCVSIISEQV